MAAWVVAWSMVHVRQSANNCRGEQPSSPDLSSDIYECESILSDSIVLLLVFPQEIQQLLLS